MGEWSKLSAKEKLDVIKFALANGVSDTNVIRDTYNIYKTGGNTKTGSGTRKITTNTKRRKTDMYFDSNRVLTNPVIEGGGQEYALTPSRVLQNVPLYTSFQITYDKDGNKIRTPYKKNPNVPWQDLRTMEELDYDGPDRQYVISPDGLTYTAYEKRPGYSNAGYVKPVYEKPEPVSAAGILSNLNSSVAPVSAYVPEGGEALKDGGKIHIAPSKRGTFTAAATKHGKSVQEFARQVLANKDNYSPAMVKKANFARNAASWKHSTGGPLYPFSFSHNPYWKTPVVRYDNGGAIGYQYGFGDWLKNLFNSKKEEEIVPEGLDYNELRRRQAYTESGFNNNAKSGAGAAGMFQIMPATLADYNAANGTSYTQKDLFNQDTNTAVRDWFIDSLAKRPWVTKGRANDSIQFAKVLAGYNFGAGNTVNALNKAKSNGVDIYNSWDWLDYVPAETKDYVNFILRNINNSISRNDSAYKAASLLNKEKVEKLK